MGAGRVAGQDSVEERRRWNMWCIGATVPELQLAVASQTGVYQAIARHHIAHRQATADLAAIRQTRSQLHWELTRFVALGDKA